MRTTYMAKTADIEKKWYVVDATDMTLGRLASEIAKVLRGKNKAIYTPHIDTGDYVIIVNADKVKVTGKKMDQKIYRRNSGWIGGLKRQVLRKCLKLNLKKFSNMQLRGCFPKMPLAEK